MQDEYMIIYIAYTQVFFLFNVWVKNAEALQNHL